MHAGRLILSLVLVVGLAFPALSRTEEENGIILTAAIEAARADDWDLATALVRRIPDASAATFIEWLRLRDGKTAVIGDYDRFLADHPDWPGLAGVRNRLEGVIPAEESPDRTVRRFGSAMPETGIGAIRLADAYLALGKRAEAEAVAIHAWRTFAMTKDERVALFTRFETPLAKHHVARLDMLLWRGLREQAEGLYTLVPDGWVKLAEARLGLRADARGVDTLIAAVPADLSDDAGLAYERFKWRVRKGRYDDARDLMLERSTSKAALGQPAEWSERRRAYARQEMRDGNHRRAYQLASQHFLDGGSDFADLEWLAGYIALRKLKDPDTAIRHFGNFHGEVDTPISLGRAGYWLGRAWEAKGDAAKAREAYAFGARHQTSFYGQLAAEKVGADPDPTLTGREESPNWRTAPFLDSTVLRAAILLNFAGQPRYAEWFIKHLGEGLDRTGLQQLADIAMEMGRPEISVRLSKQAVEQGHVLPKTYFPLTGLAAKELDVAPELAMSIARRESELDQTIISPAGARGLMQLMPGTAQKVSAKLGLAYSADKLTSDWEYNATLGSHYLAEQIQDFNGSYILAFAAYNAGPSRANAWIERYGDPRKDSMDQVDWIEHIPFRETRNYVMRVMESLHVYRARITGKAQPLQITKDLKRG
jgi:soluble lytic murein transglycosylase